MRVVQVRLIEVDEYVASGGCGVGATLRSVAVIDRASGGRARGGAALARGGAAVAVALLAVAAYRADLTAYPGRHAEAAVDVAVGVSFVVAAAVATGVSRQRVLVGVVGPLWLAASLTAWLASLPLGALLLALVSFPSARLRGATRVALALGAAALAVRLIPSGWAPALCALTAVATAARPATRSGSASRWYPPISAALVAVALLLTTWQRSRGVPPSLIAYDVALLCAAAGFPLATRADDRARRRLAATAAGEETGHGLDGLASVLRRVLDDPGLTVTAGRDDGSPPDPGPVTVTDGTGGVVVAAGGGDWASDDETRLSIEHALRLTMTNIALREEQRLRLAALEASRSRLLTVTDDERGRVRRVLEQYADPPLSAADERLAAARPIPDEDVESLVSAAHHELLVARSQVGELVAGAPPARLGQGAIQSAVLELVRSAPTRATVEVGPDVAASESVETTLYYVCSECITNSVKHAEADHLDVRLVKVDGILVLTVADDGRGGADLRGPGLRGLDDRVAARGGRLSVESLPGLGTRVVAEVPAGAGGRQPSAQDFGSAGASTEG